ncbi:MAG: 3-deoxy-7-phosphoheptulonate synthase [Coxiella sp. RIFCSPHIGHO2_12_FULL_44_14]|nr:MAG: 3-deoxy-7-phosphoheptulonate synthase [Coxiella sp. RIFCSPHIGHO2_12_FULL_44_14]
MLAASVQKNILIIMRTYFEKPRTNLGWTGLISDPHLDGSCDIHYGLQVARQLLNDINQLGVPTAIEWLDTIIPQYLADLVSWAAIGARTAESQIHRHMASGLSMPVGFKNTTSGNVDSAIDAMKVARASHRFLSVGGEGQAVIAETLGNADE